MIKPGLHYRLQIIEQIMFRACNNTFEFNVIERYEGSVQNLAASPPNQTVFFYEDNLYHHNITSSDVTNSSKL